MSKILAVEINVRESDETYFANYLKNLHDDQFTHDSERVYKENCVEPHVSYWFVHREAQKAALANNVKLIDHVKLQAGVPFVESLAQMRKDQ